MADADTTSAIVQAAGFEDVSLTRSDIDIKIGDDVDGAMALVMALGPAGELIRLAGEEGERVRPQIEAALREALSEFDGPGGVYAPGVHLDRDGERRR